MTVLDSNVLSELMKRAPSERVVAWVAAQPRTSLYTTALTQAEILHGILLLPAGRRRTALQAAADGMFAEDLAGRILPFGSEAAQAYARIAVDRQRSGHPMSQIDAQIAAIVRSSGAAIATRNVSDFEGCGIEVINPWDT